MQVLTVAKDIGCRTLWQKSFDTISNNSKIFKLPDFYPSLEAIIFTI